MMDITNILHHLFKERTLEEVPLTSVRDLADQYPYFATAQFMLAKKLKQENDDGFADQLQKTNLHFHNTLWLHHIMEDSATRTGTGLPDLNTGTVGLVDDTAGLLTATVSPDLSAEMDGQLSTQTDLTITPEADIYTKAEEIPKEEVADNADSDTTAAEETDDFVPTEAIDIAPTPVYTDPETPDSATEVEFFPEEKAPASDDVYSSGHISAEPVVDINSGTPDNSITHETVSPPGDEMEEPANMESGERETSQQDLLLQIEDAPAPVLSDDLLVVQEGITQEQPSVADEKAQDISNSAVAAEAPASRPVFPKDELAFDPFHTIDYFASLGIRLSQDPKPDDKLGQQLKSFTAWLKTMRRLPEASQAEPVEVNQADLNAHIEKIAAHSLVDREVITQAMAEVLVMQGNREKAEEIYNKLSLQNPDKSAYFAAKIDELKRH